MGEVKELYTRENIENFFKWKDDSAKDHLDHFIDELHCEDQASDYARSKPRAKGFITFKSKYKGKRYFWIEGGKAEELDAMVCFLRVRDEKYNRARDLIHSKIFKKGLPKHERQANSIKMKNAYIPNDNF